MQTVKDRFGKSAVFALVTFDEKSPMDGMDSLVKFIAESIIENENLRLHRECQTWYDSGLGHVGIILYDTREHKED